MPVRTPQDVHTLWAEAFNRGSLDALMGLYEPGASFVPQPGQVVSGLDAVRQALAGLLALRGTIHLQPRMVVQAEDVAQLLSTWTISATGQDGKPVTLTGQTTDVVRRQPDGTWRIVIDNPYGSAAAG